MDDRDLGDRRCVMRTPPDGVWSLERRLPAAALTPYLVWYWSVHWDLGGRPPHRQVTLPHISSHLVIENGAVWLHGPPRERFERVLAGRGSVVGVRFTAGGLAALLGRPLDGGPVPASILPGLDAGTLMSEVSATTGLDDAAGVLDRVLTALIPAEPDPAVGMVEHAVRIVERDRTISRVADLAGHLGLGVRALQRLFAGYVGLSPGWAIRRCRLQEAALRATGGGHVDWGALAIELGYYDQAHLVRDFTTTFGVSPARYARGEA
jgi:AraC-like DNA-binding protein